MQTFFVNVGYAYISMSSSFSYYLVFNLLKKISQVILVILLSSNE